MRPLALLFCFIALFSYGQSKLDQRIDHYQCDGALQSCLKVIESQSDLRFSYRQQTVSKIETSLDLHDVSIKQILDTISVLHNIEYEVLQDYLVVFKTKQNHTERRLIVGVVQTRDGGEVIQEALVYLPELNYMALTDKYGIFRVWMNVDSTRIIIDKQGYQDLDFTFTLNENKFYIFQLNKVPIFDPVVVKPDSAVPYYNSKAYVEISPGDLRIPSVGGETDALINLKLKSGIQNVGLGDPGLIVRGGGPDQNFILIDGVPVYNTFHLLGLYSIFNSSTINGIKLYKDAFPSKYGSRLSSVVDVSLNNGNKKRLSGDADLGIVSSGLSLSGPIVKDKISFSLAARRTYADLLTYPVQLFINQNQYQKNTTGVWYYDLFAKVHYQASERSQFKLSLYNGGDELNFRTKLELENGVEELTQGNLGWRNKLAGLQWHYILNSQLFMTAQSAYSSYDVHFRDEYRFTDGSLFQENSQSYTTGLSEFRNTIDFDLFSGNSNHILFGLGWVNYSFLPFEQSYSSRTNLNISDTVVNSTEYNSNEYYAYFESNLYMPSGLLSLGMRVSSFATNTRSYLVVQPRIFLTKNIDQNFQIRFSLTDIGQFLHLIPNNNLGLPIDIWLPVTDDIEPLRSFQLSTGVKGVFKRFEFNTSLFAKNYRNLIEHREGANFLLDSDNWINNLDVGVGSSFGFEVNSTYEINKWDIIGAYTYCRSVRIFEGINDGGTFFSKYDRPHNIRLFGRYNISKTQFVNISFTFASGNPITIPTSRYITVVGGQQIVVEEFDEINNFRLPATHHLDISYEKKKQRKRVNTTFVAGVYNIYNQLNPFMVYIGLNELAEPVLKLRSYLPLMPMLKYRIEF